MELADLLNLTAWFYAVGRGACALLEADAPLYGQQDDNDLRGVVCCVFTPIAMAGVKNGDKNG
jgi:hypothetical protein